MKSGRLIDETIRVVISKSFHLYCKIIISLKPNLKVIIVDIFLASIQLSFNSADGIVLEYGISKQFSNRLAETAFCFNCTYQTTSAININEKYPVFIGHSFDESEIPYEWKIYSNDDELLIHIVFFEDELFKEAMATVNLINKTIQIDIVPRSNSVVKTDPLFHPLGSLLMVYLANYCDGFLIHASGVKDGGNGYLFTGVSGIGKSTMGSLWKEEGALLINDDRLWIQQIDGEWKMFSTPMMNYVQTPFCSSLSKMFLLSQSPENIVSQVTKTKGALKLMSNCIQHLFDREMTASHLDTIFDLTNKVSVYELGFKPTPEVVEIIRNLK